MLLVQVLVMVGLTFAASSAGSAWSQSFRLGGTDSQAATDLLASRFPTQAGGSADVVIKAPAGVADATVRQSMQALFAELAKVDHVVAVASPYDAAGAAQISADGAIAYATVNFDSRSCSSPSGRCWRWGCRS